MKDNPKEWARNIPPRMMRHSGSPPIHVTVKNMTALLTDGLEAQFEESFLDLFR